MSFIPSSANRSYHYNDQELNRELASRGHNVGFKVLDPNYECRGFQYEIGKTFSLPPGQPLKLCESGFHFCEHAIDCLKFYDLWSENKYVEVRVPEDGNIIPSPPSCEEPKCVTDRIEIIREISFEEWITKLCSLKVVMEYKLHDYTMKTYEQGQLIEREVSADTNLQYRYLYHRVGSYVIEKISQNRDNEGIYHIQYGFNPNQKETISHKPGFVPTRYLLPY